MKNMLKKMNYWKLMEILALTTAALWGFMVLCGAYALAHAEITQCVVNAMESTMGGLVIHTIRHEGIV